jgi:hypothetical protein
VTVAAADAARNDCADYAGRVGRITETPVLSPPAVSLTQAFPRPIETYDGNRLRLTTTAGFQGARPSPFGAGKKKEK